MINQPSDDNLEQQPPAEPAVTPEETAADVGGPEAQEAALSDRPADGGATAGGASPAAPAADEPSTEESVPLDAVDAASDVDASADDEPAMEAADQVEDSVTPDPVAEDDAEEEEPEEEPEAEDDAEEEEPEAEKLWYILKVQVNREDSIRDALARRVKIAGLDEFFEEILVPTEDVAEYNKSGKRRIVKRKLYPGYIMVHMTLNDDTWFLVRETPGIGDFTGSAGKPTPMEMREVQRIINVGRDEESGEQQIKTAIPFKMGERVRVKEGNFLNFEGEVSAIDEANGRVTVMINIFGRSTPVELEHWQIEAL